MQDLSPGKAKTAQKRKARGSEDGQQKAELHQCDERRRSQVNEVFRADN
jgi:hypothetical protein